MAIDIRTALKAYFQTGDTPTQGQFENLIDSFWHKADDTLAVDWANVSSIPATFAPSAHSHAWADITGKPFTFAPSAHNHAASEITSGTLAAARLATGTATDGYIIKSVSGTPTWDVAPSGGGSTSPAGSSGQVQFNNGGAFAASANMYWDNTNSRMGIGTSSPSYALDVNGTARIVSAPTITTATKMLVKDPTTGQISEQLLPSGGGGGWGLSGNAISSGNRLGTTNTESLILMTNSLSLARFTSVGSVSLGELGTMSGASNFAAGYQASVSGSSSFALGTIAAVNASAAYAFGFNATANHSHSFIFGANGGSAVTSDAASQIKFVGSGGTRINTSNASTAFEILASGKIAAYGLATYATEAAGLAAEASGVIFKVGNVLYHKP